MTGFSEIKVGDTVFIMEGYIWCSEKHLTPLRVSRITPARFICNGPRQEYVFRKSDGFEFGGYGAVALEATPERRAEYKRQNTVRHAEKQIRNAVKILGAARGDEAIRLLAILPAELKAVE